jgi:hypothetical protein
MKVYKLLSEARESFHKIELKKTGINKFAGYSYFELSDFLIPALQVLKQHDLCAFVSFGKELATMKIVAIEDGSSIEITSPMAEANLKGCHPIQNLGAVETYTRRYLWVAALEIVEHDALDSSEPVQPVAKPVKPAAKPEQAKQDTSPKARADRIMQGVANGDAGTAAAAMAGWDNALLDSVWALLDQATQDQLTKAWPK